MDLVIGSLIVDLLEEISVVGTAVAAAWQTPKGVTGAPTLEIALIGAGGAVGAAIFGTFAAAIVKARKDLEIERLRRDKDLEIEQLRAQLRVRQDLEIEYDRDLRTRRIEYYLQLWASLLPLARYPKSGPISYNGVQKLSISLRDWYFNRGGLFMSRATRDAYFNLQDGLKIILQKRQNRWPLRHVNVWTAHGQDLLRKHLRSGEEWKIPREVFAIADSDIAPYGLTSWSRADVPPTVFENLRLLGSSLRTNIARDVLTRETSRLYSPPPAEGEA